MDGTQDPLLPRPADAKLEIDGRWGWWLNPLIAGSIATSLIIYGTLRWFGVLFDPSLHGFAANVVKIEPFVYALVFVFAALDDVARTNMRLSAFTQEFDRGIIAGAIAYANVTLLLVAMTKHNGDLFADIPYRTWLDAPIASIIIIVTFTTLRFSSGVKDTFKQHRLRHFYGTNWSALWATQMGILLFAWVPNIVQLNKSHLRQSEEINWVYKDEAPSVVLNLLSLFLILLCAIVPMNSTQSLNFCTHTDENRSAWRDLLARSIWHIFTAGVAFGMIWLNESILVWQIHP